MSGYFRAYSNRVREASRDLEERELRVWLALLSFANCEGMCWPGIKCLVDTTGLHTEAVLSALEALTTKKYIEVLRKGTRDVLTHSMLPNVYRIDGAVVDDDCADDLFRTDDPILTSRENLESQHHHVTDSRTQPESTQPETPPPPTTDSLEVEEGKPRQKRKANTPARSAIPENPPQVPASPPHFYRGPLEAYAQELATDQEEAAVAIYDELERKLTKRLARYLVATYGEKRVKWALGHLAKQTNVINPPGYVRALLERQSVEAADGQPVNPGDAYITGKYADYIDH